MNNNNVEKIFISYLKKNKDKIEELRKVVSNLSSYNLIGFLLDQDSQNWDEELFQSELKEKIKLSSMIVVFIDENTEKNTLIKWEILEANRLGKKIIGIFLPSQNKLEIPPELKKYGDALISWNSNSILATFKGDNLWQNQQGEILPANKLGAIEC